MYQWSYINWWLWRASSFLAYTCKLKKLYMDMKILQKSSLAVIHKHTQIHIMEVQIDHVHDNRFDSASVCLLECPGSDDLADLPISVWWTQSNMIVRRISLLRFHQSWWFPPFPDLEVPAMLEVAATSPNHGILQYKYQSFIIWSLQWLFFLFHMTA